MEKRILIILIVLLCMPIIISVPQFLIFQGEARIDGRIVQEGKIIFSVNGTTKIAEANITNSSYGPVLIQGFSDFYDKPINITINGSVVEQKINYTSPQNIYLNLSAITSKGLNITNFYPSGKEIEIYKTGIQNFNITTFTGYNDSVNYTWLLDGNLVSNKTSYNYTIGDYDIGEHNITAIASDGYVTRAKEWNLKIKKPSKGFFDGSTTNFSSLKLDELRNVRNVILEKKSKGKIEFLDGINLTGIDNLGDIIKIEKGIIAIDTLNYPGLNKSARITMTELSYNSIPKIYYDNGFTTNSGDINKECDFCEILSYTNFPTTNGTIIFNVEHFSSFYATGSGQIYNFSELDNLDVCEEGEIGNLNVTIKKPKEGDDFKPGEIIEIKVKVQNNNNERKKIIVESILYNLDEENDEENAKSDSQKISAGKSETFEMEIEFPDDFDEEDDYILFVKAYEKSEEENQCSQDAVGINLEREDNDLKIKDVVISPILVYPGGNIDVFVEVENWGSEDEEEIYITAKNSALGISEKIGAFEIEEYGEDDTLSERLNIIIPEDAEEGEYNLIVEVEGEESGDSMMKEFSVFKRAYEETKSEKIVLKPISTQRQGIDLEKLLETPEDFYSIINFVLFAGIIFLFVLIVIVAIVRKN